MWGLCWDAFLFFTCSLILPIPLLGKSMLFFHWLAFALCKKSTEHICGGLFLAPIEFHWFMYLPLCQYCTVLVTVFLQKVLKSDEMHDVLALLWHNGDSILKNRFLFGKQWFTVIYCYTYASFQTLTLSCVCAFLYHIPCHIIWHRSIFG